MGWCMRVVISPLSESFTGVLFMFFVLNESLTRMVTGCVFCLGMLIVKTENGSVVETNSKRPGFVA